MADRHYVVAYWGRERNDREASVEWFKYETDGPLSGEHRLVDSGDFVVRDLLGGNVDARAMRVRLAVADAARVAYFAIALLEVSRG